MIHLFQASTEAHEFDEREQWHAYVFCSSPFSMLVCFGRDGGCVFADSHPRTQPRKYRSFQPTNACWCRFNDALELAAHVTQLFGRAARFDLERVTMKRE